MSGREWEKGTVNPERCQLALALGTTGSQYMVEQHGACSQLCLQHVPQMSTYLSGMENAVWPTVLKTSDKRSHVQLYCK